MVLTDDQKALQETARRFARERLLPDYQKREKSGVLDRGLIAEMGRLGLLGTDLPEELGGLGVDSVTTGLIAEELAYGDFNVSAVPVGISLNAAILMRHAPPEVTKKLLAGQPVDPSQVYFKTVPTFETSAPELQWLTRSIFVGTGERRPAEVVIRVWRVE